MVRLVVDSLAPNWDSELYLSPRMADLARQLKATGLSRTQIQSHLATHLLAHLDEERPGYLATWQRAGVHCASTSLLFSGPPSRAWDHVQSAIARSDRLLAALGEPFRKALTPDDVQPDHHAILFNLQNADPIGDDLDRVDALHQRGVRAVQLTYNLRNLYGDGCVERRDGGLSRFGLALVERLNAAGMIVDTSHCSDQTTLDAAEASSRPVAITHASARALVDHPRAKPDHVLRAVAERGGYVGIVIMPMILTSTGRGATIDHVVDHLLHAIDVVGPEHVGIGTDWGKPYYQAMAWGYGSIRESLRAGGFDWVGWLPEHHFYPEEVCRGVETWDRWPNLAARMLERGIPVATVDGVVGGNFLRFWRAVTSLPR